MFAFFDGHDDGGGNDNVYFVAQGGDGDGVDGGSVDEPTSVDVNWLEKGGGGDGQKPQAAGADGDAN